MIWRIEVKAKNGMSDSVGASLLRDIADLNSRLKLKVRVVSVYLLEGTITRQEVRRICDELLVDPLVQQYSLDPHLSLQSKAHHVVEIAYNPGVMDPVEASTLKGIHDLGIEGVKAVRTAKQYHLYGNLSAKDLQTIVARVLMNKLIQHVVTDSSVESLRLPSSHPDPVPGGVRTIDVLLAGPKQLMEISKDGQLYLNGDEMRAIQDYFRKQKRNPTDVELETIAQTWSEHCRHKTFRGDICYRESKKGKPQIIRGLFKSTIASATRALNKKWCVSVFHDNAGVVAFDDDYHVCFKVETHNHPSALEPFGGANTGVGGVIRDILGTGLGAKPLCNTDVFCFAPPDTPSSRVPAGVLHPLRVMKGVVAGVRDYGNKMGIPTVNGAIVFDKDFIGNPLVFCGTVGLIPKGKEHKAVINGDLIVAVGGRTGRDGIHGATFSSGELHSRSQITSSGAVQIGNPIEEKKVMDALLRSRDANLYSAITDCGAGGFSSAIGEMGQKTGARVDLERAALKYQGLLYDEIWISESQERMVLAVPAQNIENLLKIFAEENVQADVLGEFDGSGRLRLFFHGTKVADLDMGFLHDGLPKTLKQAVYRKRVYPKEKLPKRTASLTKSLAQALGHYNVASKESVVRVYDHEVQAKSVVKPMVGGFCDGPSDAAVIRARLDSDRGLAVSNGVNVRYGLIDPFWMAASCVDEAIRQIIAVGGSLDRIALLDNFCWGNPDKPDRLGGLVRCAKGCHQAAVSFGTPFISGKDSLYNEYTYQSKSMSIPGTILISAMGVIRDVSRCVTMDFKKEGNSIYIIGETRDEMGGSIYMENLGQVGQTVPRVNFKKAVRAYRAVERAVGLGLIASLHDCSEGGIAVALAEMCMAGGAGAAVLLKKAPFKAKRRCDDVILFSESNSRFIAEVSASREKDFEDALHGVPHAKIGSVEASEEIIVYGLDDKPVINARWSDLKKLWQAPLK